MHRTACLAIAALALAAPHAAPAADPAAVVVYATDAPYDDVAFDLRTAIEGRGLVVDFVSHVGDMLNRTAADVGAAATLFARADVYQFCSATVSRAAMEADALNIAFCPYGVFVAERADAPGRVEIGYARMPGEGMAPVLALLDEIAREAAGAR